MALLSRLGKAEASRGVYIQLLGEGSEGLGAPDLPKNWQTDPNMTV
jgi:hypothetical protein